MVLAHIYNERIRGKKAPFVSLLMRAEIELLISVAVDEHHADSVVQFSM